MDKNRWGVHETHCCVLHGCKYQEEDCPVTNRLIPQQYICESCDWDGLKSVEHIQEYEEVLKKIRNAKANHETTIQVSVDFLNRMLDK